ncbi:MAG: hypothetical protein EBT06_07815 [Gammaproteobacteria bacterium]|nr:hypothetical protein [Gammaproteobacteria bacterium]NBT44815.1 hypothetical protein [Gammaproteobacteria bacterium]NBY22963.1 hypothetical protein [Gammaproteobacteria bacterium]NDE56944.1 hypothetical protein [Gammaproteobacteria bacterium]
MRYLAQSWNSLQKIQMTIGFQNSFIGFQHNWPSITVSVLTSWSFHGVAAARIRVELNFITAYKALEGLFLLVRDRG